MQEKRITIKDYVLSTGYSRMTIERKLKAGVLPPMEADGRHKYWPESVIREYIESPPMLSRPRHIPKDKRCSPFTK